MSDNDVLVKVQNLKKYFPISQGILVQRQIGAVKAVDDVSLDIQRAETIGLVGESGCLIRQSPGGATAYDLVGCGEHRYGQPHVFIR